MILLKFILSNFWFRAAALTALVQQILVASGTYLIGHIASEIPSKGLQLSQCILLLLCMTLSGSVVFYLMNLFSLRSQHSALQKFFETYFQNTFGKPLFWRNENERTARHDMICREAQDTIQEGQNFLFDVWTTTWNILLNTVSVVLVIGFQSGTVIIAAGIVSSLLVHLAGEKLASNARDEMDDQNKLNGHLSKSWDNLILGNLLSANLWKTEFYKLFTKANSSAEQSLRSRESILAIGNFITSGVVVGSVLFQAFMNQQNVAVVIGLFAMLPRTMQIVMHLQVVQSYWAGWQRTRERLTIASGCLSPFPEQDSTTLIKSNKIEVFSHTDSQQISIPELLNQQSSANKGRYTVRGENGAGKSVLMSQLKNKFAEAAFYLPAHHSLEIPDVQSTMSHGEKVLTALKSLFEGPHTVLLLDEWDANLSAENRNLLDKQIEALSQKRLVIEVRHNSEALIPLGVNA